MSSSASTLARRKAERPRPVSPRALQKRSAIMEAALEVLFTEGATTNLERVAEVANVSKVTIYNHFKTKDALLIEVVREELFKAHALTEDIIANRLKVATELRGSLEELCRAWVEGLRSPRLMNLRILVAGQVQRVPELGRVWIEVGPVRLHDHIAAALTEMTQRFALEIPDVELAVLQLAGLVVSPHIMYGPFGGGPDEALTERLITKGVEMFLHEYSQKTGPRR